MRSWLEVLIVSGDHSCSQGLAEFIIQAGAEPHLCSSVGEARQIMLGYPICMVFSDHTLPDGDFRDIIAILTSLGTPIPVVVYSPFEGWTEHPQTRREGTYYTNSSPYSKQEVERLIAGLMNPQLSLPN